MGLHFKLKEESLEDFKESAIILASEFSKQKPLVNNAILETRESIMSGVTASAVNVWPIIR
jgi:hypothetical protein